MPRREPRTLAGKNHYAFAEIILGGIPLDRRRESFLRRSTRFQWWCRFSRSKLLNQQSLARLADAMVAFIVDNRSFDRIKQALSFCVRPLRDCEAAVLLFFEQLNVCLGAVCPAALSDLEKLPPFRKVHRHGGDSFLHYLLGAVEAIQFDVATGMSANRQRLYSR